MACVTIDDFIDFFAVFPDGSLNKIKSNINYVDNTVFTNIMIDFTLQNINRYIKTNHPLINDLLNIINEEAKRRLIVLLNSLSSITACSANRSVARITSSDNSVKPIVEPVVEPAVEPAVEPIKKSNCVITNVMNMFIDSKGYSDISLTLNFLKKHHKFNLKLNEFNKLLKRMNKFEINKNNTCFKLKN
jgi:hypothetical protein